jgi:chromate reductase, NAD(P)H dehydrogenase (quinone)
VSEKDFKILGLAASLRRASIHRGILRAAHEVCPEGMACDSFDLGRIPFFNADVEAKGDPEAVRELKEKIRTYNAVLIATPRVRLRHTRGAHHRPRLVPKALLALQAQAGRHRRRESERGRHGPRADGLEADPFARPGLRDARARMLIPNAYQRFDENGDLTDRETRQRLRRFLEALREWNASLDRAGLLE